MKSVFESKVLSFLKFCRVCLSNCTYSGNIWERLSAKVQNQSLCEISPNRNGILALTISLVSALSIPFSPLPSSCGEPYTSQFTGETAF